MPQGLLEGTIASVWPGATLDVEPATRSTTAVEHGRRRVTELVPSGPEWFPIGTGAADHEPRTPAPARNRPPALEQEIERIGPPVDPDLDRAGRLLDRFASFWEIEQNFSERRALLGQFFDRIWQDGSVIVAVRPRAPFAGYFATVADIQAISEIPETPVGDAGCKKRERRGSNPRFTPRIEIRA